MCQCSALGNIGPHLGNFALSFGEVFLLSLFQKLRTTSNSKDDAVSHSVVMETEINSSFVISSEQCLGDQPINIWNTKQAWKTYTFIKSSLSRIWVFFFFLINELLLYQLGFLCDEHIKRNLPWLTLRSMSSEVRAGVTSMLDVSSITGSSSSTGISSRSGVSVAGGSASSSTRLFSSTWIRKKYWF